MQAPTALITAIQSGDLEQVKRIIDEQPTFSGALTESGIPVSLLAAYYQQPEIFRYLLSHRTAPSIYEAAAGGLTGRVKFLLTEHPELLDAHAPDGFTPLGLACYFAQPAVVAILVAAGADVNLPANNPSKVAPLHSAVAADSVDIAHLLLESGATVDAGQNGGITALHSAAHRGNEVMVRLLLDYGATVELSTDDGRTALDFAEADGHQAVVQLLQG